MSFGSKNQVLNRTLIGYTESVAGLHRACPSATLDKKYEIFDQLMKSFLKLSLSIEAFVLFVKDNLFIYSDNSDLFYLIYNDWYNRTLYTRIRGPFDSSL